MEYTIKTACGYETSTFNNHYDCFKDLSDAFEGDMPKIELMTIEQNIGGKNLIFKNENSELLNEAYNSQSWA